MTTPHPAASPAKPPHVVVRNLELRFGERRVFQGLSCSFPAGRITVVLGASGGGKSSLLRAIGGLIPVNGGEVLVAGESVTAGGPEAVRRARRKIGMMFQRGALLDSMTVFQNLALPLREHRSLTDAQITAHVRALLGEVGLYGVEQLLPGQLSGGMTKRAALARALIEEPEILLCDEPFSGLDPVAVRRIESLLEEINERLGVTMIVTSHHIPSTLRMADEVVFLLDGIALEASPELIRTSTVPQVREYIAAEDPEAFERSRRKERRGGDPAAVE